MKTGQAAIWLLTVILTVYAGLFLVQEYTKVDVMCRIGDIWSLIDLREDSPGVFTTVDPEDYPGDPVPEPGDTLVTVAGLPATIDNYFSVFSTATPAGLALEIEFREPDRISLEGSVSTSMAAFFAIPLDIAFGTGVIDPVGATRRGWSLVRSPVVSTMVITRSIPTILKVQYIFLFVIRVLITASLFGAGIHAFAKRPDEPAVRVMTLFCLAMAAFMVFPVQVINIAYATFRLPLGEGLLKIIGAAGYFAAPLWLHLHMLFPRVRSNFTAQRRRVLAGIYLPVAALVALNLFTDLSALRIASGLLVTAYFVAGFVMLGRARRLSADLLERRQARVVMWASAPGFLLFLILTWAQVAFMDFFMSLHYVYRLYLVNLQFLSILPAPLGIAHAMAKYRLHEVESRYRRGTMFLAVNALLLATFVAFVYGMGRALSSVAGIGGTTPILIISLSLAVGFSPAQRRLRNSIEDRVFPERKRLRALLGGFLQETRGVAEREAFWTLLGTRLAEGLDADPVVPVIRNGMGRAELFARGTEPSPFQTGDEFVRRLCSEGRPLLLDELLASGRIPVDPEQRIWFSSRRIALLLPLPSHEDVIGFVAVGRKRSGEDYRAFELETLGSLSGQFALSAENIELMEEKVEKKKLQEQLSIARTIQQGLLPGALPETPGLEVSASIVFCLEVAGDYYDVVPMTEGRTLLAVGDATGKGVGPALLMASLQATLRSISGVDISLADMMGRVNRLVFANTSPEYFITLFAAVFDPGTGTLEWVNAGHNPPLLKRASGEMTMLWDGGLLLGVSRDAAYVSGRTVLERGDVLVMYTDGLTEAMDGSGEEYGERRLAGMVDGAFGDDPCAVIRVVVEDVGRFHGGNEFGDDFTMMVARRL